MAPTKKSIYRQPGTQHFQLVHRSVRDPLANDPDAPQQVFKPIERYNVAGKEKGAVSLAELEHQMDKTKIRENEGEAAMYGITYDDSKYDYMQHLKPVGEEGFESVLLPAPRGSSVAQGMKNQGQRSKGKGRSEDMFKMPEDVLASKHELSLQEVRERQQNIPTELQGFNPDMDPHLRQVLEALDDEEFIEDDGNDEDFFGELVGTGEAYDEYDREEYEFHEWGPEGKPKPAEEGGEPREETWEDRFRAFKEAGGRPNAPISNGGWESGEGEDFDEENRSEMADTVGSLSGLPDMIVKGGKKRHGKRGPSDASGMSMSSASVYRNNNLRNLDDQFDRIEREYELDDDDEWCEDDDDDVSIAPSYMSSASRVSMFKGGDFEPGEPLQVTRDDFDAIMDDFLENYEVVGNRMRESLGGTALSGPEKLKVLRSALEQGDEGLSKEENRRRILALEKLNRGPLKEDKERIPRSKIEPAKEDKWDVETILSTYTNTENHPGMIRVRSSKEAKERAARKAAAAVAAIQEEEEQEEEEEDSGSETETEAPKVTVSRKKGESAEEKRARKAAVKAERANRRAEKKSHKETFNEERKRQIAGHRKAVTGGKAADIAVGAKGVHSLR